MKKILFISPSPLNNMGGIDTYNNYLINIITKYYPDSQIDFVICDYNRTVKSSFSQIRYHFPFLNILKETDNILKKIYLNTKRVYIVRKYIYNLLKSNSYKLIIDCSFIYFRKLEKYNNYFLIQHNFIEQYVYSLIKKNKYRGRKDDIFNVIFLHKLNTLKNIKNLIVYDVKNAEYAKKFTKANIEIIPLCMNKNNQNNMTDCENYIRDKIIYFGRLNQIQKNLLNLMKINEKINLVDFYGKAGSEFEQDILNKLIEKKWYKGYINHSILDSIVQKYKFSILYSNYEGFSFSLVESLSCGVPIIVKDTFLSASYLCNENTGLLLDKNNSIEKDAELIRNFYAMNDDKYIKLCKSSKQFYENNLSFNNFENKWKLILKKFLI